MSDRRRALLTDTERERIAGKGPQQRQYESVSRVRRRVKEELPKDIALLKEHHEDLLEEIRDVVCEEGDRTN